MHPLKKFSFLGFNLYSFSSYINSLKLYEVQVPISIERGVGWHGRAEGKEHKGKESEKQNRKKG